MLTIRLENAEKDWILFGGYETKEHFDISTMEIGEVITFFLYEHKSKVPSIQAELKLISKSADREALFSDNKVVIKAIQSGDLTWHFTFMYEDKVYLPPFNKNIGKLGDLLDEVVDEARYAVCLEGIEAGKIVKISATAGYGWNIEWTHNKEKAKKHLLLLFALLDREKETALLADLLSKGINSKE